MASAIAGGMHRQRARIRPAVTKSGQRVQARILRYLENPVKNPLSVIALRGEKSMAKSRRKAPTAKQLAARAKFAARYGGKKTARRGKKRRAASAAALTENRAPAKRRQEEEETMELEENPRKKSRRKKSKAKRQSKASSRRRKAPRRKKASRKRARRAAPKKRRSSRRRAAGRVHVVRFPRAQRVKIIRVKSKPTKKRRKSRRRSRRQELALLENPSTSTLGSGAYEGLFDNPSLKEAYSMDNTKAFLLAAGGIALGLVFARGVDRFVATMKPKDSGNLSANNPQYGRNAAFMQQTRPGALRLGVQGLLALGGIGAAYATRNNRYLPWALGGIALGAGANLGLQVAEWFILPRIPGLKVEAVNEATFANRMYVTEQVATQDIVADYIENWDQVPSLARGQTTEPTIEGILTPAGGSDPSLIYALGGAQHNQLGGCGANCGNCGGRCNGCGGGGGGQLCSYVVQDGDDLAALLAAAGVSISAVNALNNGNYWVPGNQVVLPYAMCMSLTGGGGTPAIPQQPNGGGGGTIVFQPVGPGSAPTQVYTDIPGGPGRGVPVAVVRGTPEKDEASQYIPVDAAAEED